jgi:hypothetical protein
MKVRRSAGDIWQSRLACFCPILGALGFAITRALSSRNGLKRQGVGSGGNPCLEDRYILVQVTRCRNELVAVTRSYTMAEIEFS